MNVVRFALAAAVFSGFALAQPNKIAVISIQQAIVTTKDGQKAANELTSRFEPRQKALEAKQSDIGQLQNELSKGSNTMAEAKRVSLTREIDAKTKSLQRDTQDAREEFEQEQNKILNDLGQRMMVIIDKYAKDNGYAVVIDISPQQQSPILWAANGIDITKEIIDLYDKNSPSNIPAAPKPGSAGAPPVTSPVKPPVQSPAVIPPASKKTAPPK